MSPARCICLGLLFALSITSDRVAQAEVRGQAGLPAESTLNRLGLTRRWWSHATLNPQRDKLLFMTADETHLFLQSDAGVITAFDSETGKHLWSRPIGRTDLVSYPATLNDDLLLVVNGLTMLAVGKNNGDIVWELKLPHQPSSSPAADKRRAFVGFLDGSLYEFDLRKIAELYRQQRLPQYADEAIVWRFRTSKPIIVPAVPAGSTVAFAGTNGSLYSVGVDDRRLNFQFETDAPLSAPIVRFRDHLLLASEDTNFYSLALKNGQRKWEFTTGQVIRKAPVLIENEVYLLPEHGSLIKLSAETGRPLWPKPVPRIDAFLAATSGKVYAVGGNNSLEIVSRDQGQLLGQLSLDRFTQHFPNDASDRIYVATESGVVMCLNELGRDFPRYHRHPERLPVLPEFAPEGADAEATPESPPAEDAPADEPAADDAEDR